MLSVLGLSGSVIVIILLVMFDVFIVAVVRRVDIFRRLGDCDIDDPGFCVWRGLGFRSGVIAGLVVLRVPKLYDFGLRLVRGFGGFVLYLR